MSHSLLPPESGPERDDDIDRSDTNYRLPSVRAPVFASLSHPAHGDEPVMKPVELEQDGEEEGGWRMNEDGVHGSFEGLRVFEQGEVDCKAGD